MEKLIIIIEKSKDHYSAYADNCEGVYGAGDTLEEARTNVLEGLRLYKETARDLPEILKGEVEIEYKYDVASFLKYYSDIITLSGLSKLTGINQGQLSHYINGLKKPRKDTVEKVEKGLHKLGKELSQVTFV